MSISFFFLFISFIQAPFNICRYTSYRLNTFGFAHGPVFTFRSPGKDARLKAGDQAPRRRPVRAEVIATDRI